MSDGLMQLNDVQFAYHDKCYVVDGLSAQVHPGKVHALIGPNAAGKTTLLKLMLGQLQPSCGKVMLNGVPVARVNASQRAAAISYVPQRSTTGFAFTVAQVVAMGRHVLPWSEAALDEALEACELKHLADRPYNELSGGQQQRVLLARALAQSHGEGKVMLLDEPVSAMDLQHVHRAMAVLRDQAGRGLAIVTVLHDLNLAARYADEVWLIDNGKMMAHGDWRQVLTPDVLSPVYGVDVRTVENSASDDSENARPIFHVRLQGGGNRSYN